MSVLPSTGATVYTCMQWVQDHTVVAYASARVLCGATSAQCALKERQTKFKFAKAQFQYLGLGPHCCGVVRQESCITIIVAITSIINTHFISHCTAVTDYNAHARTVRLLQLQTLYIWLHSLGGKLSMILFQINQFILTLHDKFGCYTLIMMGLK